MKAPTEKELLQIFFIAERLTTHYLNKIRQYATTDENIVPLILEMSDWKKVKEQAAFDLLQLFIKYQLTVTGFRHY